jgi:hypothetical protein
MRQTLTLLGIVIGLACGTVRAADVSSVDTDGTVTIRPGEAFEIAFPDRNDLAHPKFSRALDHIDSNVPGYRKADPNAPPPSGPALMSFELKNDGTMLILNVRNDTGLAIKYDANMVVHGRSAHTSICPIFPGMLGNETWMDPIEELKLSGFRKVEQGNSFACD